MTTRQLLTCALFALAIMHHSMAVGGDDVKQSTVPINICEQQDSYIAISKSTATTQPVQVQLPELEGVPSGTIDRLQKNPHYIPILQKYPALAKKQHALEASSQSDKIERLQGISPPLPIYQMFDQWIGTSESAYYAVGTDGKKSKIALGLLSLPPYKRPSVGKKPPADYVQPRADLAKSLLFYIGDEYYSVYGDCQIAKHVPLKGVDRTLAALRYAGNPLYACSEGLPPSLQSCGTDNDKVIWLADEEGHVVLFRTTTLDFLQKCITLGKSKRVLIPRNNQSRSAFAFNSEKAVFQEYRIDAEGTASIAANGVALPGETRNVLFSDASRVVFLTDDKAVVCKRDANDKDKMYSVPLKLDRTKTVWESLYLAKGERIALLVGPSPQISRDNPEVAKLEETRKSWNNMTLVVVSMLSEAK